MTILAATSLHVDMVAMRVWDENSTDTLTDSRKSCKQQLLMSRSIRFRSTFMLTLGVHSRPLLKCQATLQCYQSGEVPNWDAHLTSLVAIATYTLPIGHATSSSAIGLLSACAICWIYGKGLHLARKFSFLLAVEF